MNLLKQKPFQKTPKAKPNPRYLRKVRQLPCIICESFGMEQTSPTTAHHPIHDRFSRSKVPDEMAIPLCCGHHQGNFDTSKVAIHRESEKWRELYGADHEYIAGTQDRIAKESEE